MIEKQINQLLKIRDNSEIIRDRIAAILKLELTGQKELADSDPEIEDKKDFDIKVYIENSRPWIFTSNKKEASPFPLVNVALHEVIENTNSPGATVGKVKYKGKYYIDCYGCGNIQPENIDEYVPDDSLSAIRAWHTGRVIRNILMSGFYVFLGMQGIVQKRKIIKMSTVIPAALAESAISITACRIEFEVEFYEVSPEGEGVSLEGLSFVSKDGEVTLINI